MFMHLIKSIITLLFFCITGFSTHAQMEPAKKIIPDYTHDVFIKNTPVKIWRIIRDLPQVKSYANGMIKEVKIITDTDGTRRRELLFSDNRQRTDIIEQVHESYKFFVFRIKEPLPAGISNATVTALVESVPDKDDTTVVRWTVFLEGDKNARKPLVDELIREIAQYEKGLKQLTEAH